MLRPRPLPTSTLGTLGTLGALVALVAVLVALAPAARAGKPRRYHFELVEVKAGAGVTVDATTVDAIRAEAEKVLASHPQLVATLTGAPPLDADLHARVVARLNELTRQA